MAIYDGLQRGSVDAELVFVILLLALGGDIPNLRLTAFREQRADRDSQHNTGTAADFGVRTPREREAANLLLARWREFGLVGVAEDCTTPAQLARGCTAPHVHVQLFPAGLGVVQTIDAYVDPFGILEYDPYYIIEYLARSVLG